MSGAAPALVFTENGRAGPLGPVDAERCEESGHRSSVPDVHALAAAIEAEAEAQPNHRASSTIERTRAISSNTWRQGVPAGTRSAYC